MSWKHPEDVFSIAISCLQRHLECGIFNGLCMGFVFVNFVYEFCMWPFIYNLNEVFFLRVKISMQATLLWRQRYISLKLQNLISMIKVICLNDGRNGNKVLIFTWLPLVWMLIHRGKHCYFTVLGQMYRTFLRIYKTLVRHTRLQWMP